MTDDVSRQPTHALVSHSLRADANGFFLFDIMLPASYPAIAPSVKFLTTGGGSVRRRRVVCTQRKLR